MKPLPVHVWSDVACPWCWIGKKRLEAALARFDGRDRVELTFHSFELDPSAPRAHDGSISYAERLAKKYRRTAEQARRMLDDMTATARGEGLAMDFSRIRPSSTFDAHRMLHLAKERGVQREAKERLFRAYFAEGAQLSDPATLVRLATEVGIDEAAAHAVATGDDYAVAVRSDEADAEELGISGVPFFVIGRYGVSGAQPAELLLRVLGDASSEPA